MAEGWHWLTSQVEPFQVEPFQVEPVQIELPQAESSQAQPSQAGSSQVGRNQLVVAPRILLSYVTVRAGHVTLTSKE